MSIRKKWTIEDLKDFRPTPEAIAIRESLTPDQIRRNVEFDGCVTSFLASKLLLGTHNSDPVDVDAFVDGVQFEEAA